MKVTIRRAKITHLTELQLLGTELMKSDISYVPELDPNWYYEEEGTKYLLKNIRNRNRVCLIAIIEDEIIGYASGLVLKEDSWRKMKRVELVNLVVTAKYRNNGAGHLLMNAFKEWGKSKGAERFKVQAAALNNDAIRFYKNNGFQPLLLTLETK